LKFEKVERGGGDEVDQLENRPTDAEVGEQLQKMEASKRFRGAPSQWDFLKLVVERALQGKKSREEDIGKILFPGFLKDESTDVRVTAGNLRKTINRYYRQEGHDDLVRIDLPMPEKNMKIAAGQSYTPVFTYNPLHSVGKDYKLGMFYLKRGQIDDYSKAVKHFVNVLKITPEHVGACLGFAESMIGAGVLYRLFDAASEEDDSDFYYAAYWLDRAHPRAVKYWRLWAAGGWLQTAIRKLGEAGKSFDTALLLDRSSTESYHGYMEFLAETGRKDEAKRLGEEYLTRRFDDIRAHAFYGRLLLGMGEHFVEEAEKVFRRALEIDKGYYEIYMWLATIEWKAGRMEECRKYLRSMRLTGDYLTYGSLCILMRMEIEKE
jgi:tetratricopeptide (TPR) repeat protein